ncbi:MAG: type I restriction endonuclease subunit R [Actinobacteria bacterium]|nr:type I restriction endonuclease subunit R [Actinomycetota bacterium]
MAPDISERSFEETIEKVLTSDPEAFSNTAPGEVTSREPYGDWLPGGYLKRKPGDYDRSLCLIPGDVIAFIYATQPKEWAKLEQHHGTEVREKFLGRLSREIERRGALDVLRNGVKDSGCKFKLAFFHPASGLNEELQRLYEANIFSVVRQLQYSDKSAKSIDLALFLNGIPIFTAELKNPLTGQNVENAVRQYRHDRDPREPLFSFRRCLAHFAVDPDLVYVTTRLAGLLTSFIPFNQGKYGGAGNPPVPPTQSGYATSYLWERIWARDSVLELIQHFIQEVEVEDEDGRRTGERVLIFPRYHQLDAVRRLVRDAREKGPGQHYLIQHSAGSGKSNTIAWLAHRLSILHDSEDRRVFDSIVVITDRRVIDRQLQSVVKQFEQTLGIVENIDRTSRQLKEALEGGKTIIVSTLQKYPVIAGNMQEMPGKRFAVIVDEAHSSQTGESVKGLKSVLAVDNLEEAEAEDSVEPEDFQDVVAEQARKRGRLPNVSFFAFTATPKSKTLELFGTRRPDGKFEAFSLYSMRQAIEEGFILDVLENYTTYKTYWKLLKTIEEDPAYDRGKATYILRSFVDLHEHSIRKKVEIMVEHFHDRVAHRIDGQAKAMVVTRSRLHAVRFKLAMDAYLRERGYPYRTLVAFSGTVKDGGMDYTEAGMNGIPEAQTAKAFKRPEYRFLIVAEKFQTGYDMPLLHTMYVDRKLSGVHAVQTLSRLNRIYPPAKTETMVLDFVNEAEDIREAFQEYYEKTILSEETDPNLLYDLERRLAEFGVFNGGDVEAFAGLYFRNAGQDQLYAALAPSAERFAELTKEEKADFRGVLDDYVRLYAFLSQVVTFVDPDLEKLYVFARLLRRYLPYERERLPLEIQQDIDMESYRITRRFEGPIVLERGQVEIPPIGAGASRGIAPEDIEPLSEIIRELNERFGTDFSDEDKVFISQLEERLAGDPSLRASVRANTPENARLTFDYVVTDRLQEMVDTNFEFYKRVTDDRAFAEFFLDWLFERFRKSLEGS